MLWLPREGVGPIHRTRWTVHLLLLLLLLRVVVLLLLWWHLHRHALSCLLHWHEWNLFGWPWAVVVLRLRRRHLLVVGYWRDRHSPRWGRHVQVSSIGRVTLAVIAVVCRHGRTRHRRDWRSLVATLRVLVRHGRHRYLSIAVAQGGRRGPVTRALQTGRVDVRRPDLRHRRKWTIVSPRFVSLALQTGSRFVSR